MLYELSFNSFFLYLCMYLFLLLSKFRQARVTSSGQANPVFQAGSARNSPHCGPPRISSPTFLETTATQSCKPVAMTPVPARAAPQVRLKPTQLIQPSSHLTQHHTQPSTTHNPAHITQLKQPSSRSTQYCTQPSSHTTQLKQPSSHNPALH